jgi:hypothetical protein
VKEWTRGTPIEAAVTVYEAEHDDIAATGMSTGQGACEMHAALFPRQVQYSSLHTGQGACEMHAALFPRQVQYF